ncbi:MAG: biotin--[acetyl-CoA-carboxylase] ligase [Lachnospiraceae bacterium]|nr:biotin--[acetyl-CoA-carboxylase] ligase [Lachnospiraceae bacterium]
MRTAVLKALRSTDGYISGQSICDALDVSRTAVWKDIKKLKEEGYDIESVSNRGYRLKSAPDILEEHELYSIVDTKWAGREIHFFEETDSTNIKAKQYAEEGCKNGTLVITENQTAGRGRRGRNWISPIGANIAMTLVLKPDFEPKSAAMVTLVTAMACAAAINKVYEVDAKIKWPNDIVLDGKKVIGILTEMSAEIDYINYLVVGVGINVHPQDFAPEIKEIAGAIESDGIETHRRSELVCEFLREFERYYDVFCETQDLRNLKREYERLLVNIGKQVKVLDPKEPFEGKARGITDTGELIVDTWDKTMAISSGEVSVRGLYGYV